ncbi:YgiQ family radical SAM protein [Ruminococcus sp.]|uniref:YgiQ family radical SAM protein n=1 Tax=Ruminococcus sp. TaxID=41978 RepID=UPI00263960FC|nr:YgiQ family radical SAM protein [Ruminococcus sp.]MDD7556242.1 YgiQ family radical SAM protein [Ruminococcus sp.]MDY4963724.1 YgiQ family radical SAM protein [Ruminococcus callidus]
MPDTRFLPMTREELNARGIDVPDFVYVIGDAYVDHPSFGAAIISRVLEAKGFSVAILSQPDWRSHRDFTRFGRPRLGFLVTSGNIDSMVAHYTAAKRKRSQDAYSPGGKAGKRPDRAVLVYCRKLRELYGDVPIIIGGMEASLRRFAHYDYWDDRVRPSILEESGADLLLYGMGEHSIIEVAQGLRDGIPVGQLTEIRGSCYMTAPEHTPLGSAECPSYAQVCESKQAYAKACRIQYDQQDEIYGKRVIQRHGSRMLVQNPPALSLTTEELDWVYSLPYTRTYHPSYEAQGGVPGIEEVQFSITHNRGCFGFCNFCSIALHQGRRVTVRSEESVLAEAERIVQMPNFKGYIHDVGGPTANFRHPSCEKQLTAGLCKGKKCLAPAPCKGLHADHEEYLHMLRQLRKIKGVKRVFIRSGIRYDYLMADPDDTFMRELIRYHVSGQLKVAPEHCAAAVLDKMGKPHIEAYLAFQKKFYEITKGMGKEQYLVPYLMSSHPGSTLQAAVELAVFLKQQHIHPEQVQDFYPTPGTLSTCMFYTELDPYTMEPVYVPKTPEEKAMQRALLQYFQPKNKPLVLAALKKAGRRDLIGTGPDCLVTPDEPTHRKPVSGTGRGRKDGKAWKKERGAGRRGKGRG